MNRHFIFLSLALCLLPFVLKSETLAQKEQESATARISPPDTSLERKSPTGALLRSVAFPGWGQSYNRKYFKAVAVFGAETTFITLAAIEWNRMNTHRRNFENPDHPDREWEFEQFQFYEDRRNLFLWITAGIVFLSMFDAYVDAHLYNFDREKVRDLPISLITGPDSESNIRIVFSIPL